MHPAPAHHPAPHRSPSGSPGYLCPRCRGAWFRCACMRLVEVVRPAPSRPLPPAIVPEALALPDEQEMFPLIPPGLLCADCGLPVTTTPSACDHRATLGTH